ncbi:hypothetical protein [Ignatzschineria sp. LJL83]
MKKLTITGLVLATALLANQSFAYKYHNNGDYNNGYHNNYSPVTEVLVGETQGAYGKKFCSYQKLKNGQVIAQYTKTVSNRIACPTR